MVQQRSGPTPTEESPLLAKPKKHANGHADSNSTGYVSIGSSSFSDEESQGVGEVEESSPGGRHVAAVIGVLLIGIFVGHADGSILLATHASIASEFNDLGNSSWLITGFALAGAATQTLYGKLSDIYGRKTLVIAAYVIFVVGCFLVGIGQTMWQVILGRVISGAGSSGMTGLVSILIADLVPIREVAAWRAYVNLVATLGRSIGGPLGGWLVDIIGWRWSFYIQVPPILSAIFLIIWCLPETKSESLEYDSDEEAAARRLKSKLSRVDFKGSILFALVVLTFLLPVELGGVELPWTSGPILGLFALSTVLLYAFIVVERGQEEPILPLEIFERQDAVISYMILGLQTAAQVGLMFSVPLYFQITARASNTVAGAHLVPAVVGNAIGGVISGLIIKRSGRYKVLIISSVTVSSICYLLLMARWHGNTGFLESLYIFPGGFGTGIAQSAVFISLQAVVDQSHMAPAISFMYLSSTLGVTAGLPVINAVLQTALRRSLGWRLPALGLGGEEARKIIENAVSDVDYLDQITGKSADP
ncbi:uncharacterized protein CTHT_0047650 [Thermochaetoides thermophila DSM 1495]|uniref:Major facilitator superfamily (MFS) profile domain-containing protein n=1 Tax=Chaetomium thermophilum (strain DSM 1495 / CBS 144.50 / IMI 039719) TaxID=759272 RepID=G0SAT1_CHATD|nr:hypothetical protein CTHT_0047650 [Thermochaetoides thermophila DSM 1495]EGS19311.1 hypothetical protein CTHT_0047650 [Thermochaetoides thermophila DSM 1495]